MAETAKTPTADVSPYLKQVRVRDYPPLRDAKVDFKPGLNIIIGKNGSGKTRFVSLVSELADLYNDTKYLKGTNHALTLGGVFDNSQEINVKFDERFDDEPLERKIQIAQNSPYSEAFNKESLKFVFSNKFYKLFSCVLINYNFPTTSLPIIDENAEITAERRNFNISLRNGVKQLDEISTRFVRILLQGVRSAIKFNPALPNGESLEELIHEDILRTINFYLTRLNHLLPAYSPIQEVQCNKNFQVYHDGALSQYKIKGLVLEYQVGGRWLPFSSLSDGSKRLFYILAEISSPAWVKLLYSYGELDGGSEEKIIFLEEPELGIHPDQLQKLLSLIREVSKEHQVIMTTHSPQVLNMLTKQELDRITICELDPEKGTQFRKLSRAKQAKARAYMRDDSYLSDFWLYSNLEAE